MLPNEHSPASTPSSSVLPDYPYAGKYLEEHGIYETWIGKTPFVIFYRVDAQVDIITVLALFHHAQERAAFDPED